MKHRKGIFLIILAVLITAAACSAWAAYKYASRSYTGEKTRIFIPAGASVESVTDTLTKNLGEYGATVARLWQWRDGKTATAHGSYVVEPGIRAWSMAGRLKTGRQTPLRVTFNNIRLMDDLAERVAARMEFGKEDFTAAADSVLRARGFKGKAEFPAAFIPDTYEFYWTAPADEVVATLAGYRDRFWSPERRKQAEDMGLTPVEVATIASIVEEETAKTDERGKVARLYLNRLEKGMLLQADPTVKYAVGDFTLRRIGGRMLQTPSPYNTYVTPGLPPGPIRIPERATLQAVLDAPQHNYLYMCAKADFSGYHNFATDFETHRANAAAYQRELNRRNISLNK